MRVECWCLEGYGHCRAEGLEGWRAGCWSPEGHGRWRVEGWCLERLRGLVRRRASDWLGCRRVKGLGCWRADSLCLEKRLLGLGSYRASDSGGRWGAKVSEGWGA